MERTILVGLRGAYCSPRWAVRVSPSSQKLINQRFTLDEQPVAHLSARVGGDLPLLLYSACDRRFRANRIASSVTSRTSSVSCTW